jgi:hypothetical protein
MIQTYFYFCVNLLRNRNLYPHYRIYCCLHISKKKKRRKGRRRGRKK